MAAVFEQLTPAIKALYEEFTSLGLGAFLIPAVIAVSILAFFLGRHGYKVFKFLLPISLSAGFGYGLSRVLGDLVVTYLFELPYANIICGVLVFLLCLLMLSRSHKLAMSTAGLALGYCLFLYLYNTFLMGVDFIDNIHAAVGEIPFTIILVVIATALAIIVRLIFVRVFKYIYIFAISYTGPVEAGTSLSVVIGSAILGAEHSALPIIVTVTMLVCFIIGIVNMAKQFKEHC